MIRHFLLTALCVGSVCASAWAAGDSISDLSGDSRIKTILYDETDVYTITTKYGYQTNVIFSPKEEIQTISVGDRSLWQIIPAGNRLFIRPMEDDITTNMTVITNKHSYYFDIKSIAADKTTGNIYVAKFIYPDEKKKEAPAPETMHAAATTAVANPVPTSATAAPSAITGAGITQPGLPNYNYTYSGPDNLAPVQIFDDGKSTFFKFSDISQPLPNIFIVGAHGQERAVSYYVNPKNLVVVDTVAEEMALKSTAGTVHIYNETLNPGTTSQTSSRE